MRVLCDEQSGPVAAQLGAACPGEQSARDAGRDDKFDDLGAGDEPRDRDICEGLHQAGGGQIEDVLGVDMADLVGDDGERFLVIEPFDQGRVEHDDRLFDAARKGVDHRVLLDEHIRHLDAERRAGDLQFCVQVGDIALA